MSFLDLIWQKWAAAIPGLPNSRPSFRFDPAYYGLSLPGYDQSTDALWAHYQSHGKTEGRMPNLYQEAVRRNPALAQVVADLVIDPDLMAAIEAEDAEAAELAFELIHLGAPIDADVADFSMASYLEMHSDIKAAAMDPLLHYLNHGHAEGRRILRDIRAGQYAGRLPYRPGLPTVLIALHECSRTGAPIVGRDLAREAARTHNVIISALRDGPLLEDLRDTACQVLITSVPFQDFAVYSGEAIKKIDFAILNSVESYVYVALALKMDIPFVSYIHEYTNYTFPSAKSIFSAIFTDLVIFSSNHVRENWIGRMTDICFDMNRDSIVIPQRKIVYRKIQSADFNKARAKISKAIGKDLSKSRIICGAGHIQLRKGTDIFAMTASICKQKDPDTVFIWVGDGLNREELSFGAWMDYQIQKMSINLPDGNLFFLPSGPAYLDLLKSADAMYVSSRIDPLPNVVFDALDHGCSIVLFEDATGFSDDVYRRTGYFKYVEYLNPAAAADVLITLPQKTESQHDQTPVDEQDTLFETIAAALQHRLDEQRYFVRGASQTSVPVIFAAEAEGSPLRIREREKMMRYGRRLVWRDLDEVALVLEQSDNWSHRNFRLAPFGISEEKHLPEFSMHLHAFYIDELADDLENYCAYQHANRIVVTTDTEQKAAEIHAIMSQHGLIPEITLVPNKGRDILPFLELFKQDGAARSDEIWCHLHLKKSVSTTKTGDIWRRFLMRILLGDDQQVSDAITTIADEDVGLVAPFDPYFIGWNETRHILPKFTHRLPGPMPQNPLLFPVGNMFWVRRSVVLAMNDVFGPDYPWPSEPIANDGTEYHLIERLWPAMSTYLDLDSVFIHKLDEQRV